MSEEVQIFAALSAGPGQEDALREVLSELVAATRTEPGNLHYMLNEELEKPGNFHLFESYKDKAAVDAHMQSPHFLAGVEKLKPLLATQPSIVQTKLVTGD
jgi:quinol monooxygenase YgiN